MSKKLAMIFGVVFVLVGLLGFIGNPIVGESGIFYTNALHNIIHLVIGIVLIAVAKNEKMAVLWMKIFGIVYLLVALLGFMIVSKGGSAILGLVAVNAADNWLHVALAVILLIAGFMCGGKKMLAAPASSNM